MAKNITMDDLIEISVTQSPVIYFEVGRDIIEKIQRMHDSCERYFWSPRHASHESARLLGYQIRLVDGDSVRLVTELTDKTNTVLRREV